MFTATNLKEDGSSSITCRYMKWFKWEKIEFHIEAPKTGGKVRKGKLSTFVFIFYPNEI